MKTAKLYKALFEREVYFVADSNLLEKNLIKNAHAAVQEDMNSSGDELKFKSIQHITSVTDVDKEWLEVLPWGLKQCPKENSVAELLESLPAKYNDDYVIIGKENEKDNNG